MAARLKRPMGHIPKDFRQRVEGIQFADLWLGMGSQLHEEMLLLRDDAGRKAQQAHVREEGNRQLHDIARCGEEIQRSTKDGTGVRQERQTMNGILGRGMPRVFLSPPGHLLPHFEQLDKHPYFGPQNLGYDGSRQIVDCAAGIALGRTDLIGERRQKDDRRGTRPAMFANQPGRFKSVHVRHVDVEQNHCKLILQHLLECLRAG